MLRTLAFLTLFTTPVIADLVDGGFETNPFESYVNVAGSPFVVDRWAPENGSAVTGPDNGILPFAGNQMLRMEVGFIVAQTPQIFDVSSFSTLIDNGNAQLDFGAYFNVPSSTSAADARITVYFQPATTTGTIYTGTTGIVAAQVITDSDTSTWELASGSSIIPANTRSVAVELSYAGSTVNGNPGYVDNAFASVTAVPEPSSALSLLLLATGLVSIRRLKHGGFTYADTSNA